MLFFFSLLLFRFTHIAMGQCICMADSCQIKRKKGGGLEIGTGQTAPSFPYGASVRIMQGENT